MDVKLLAHTQLSAEFRGTFDYEDRLVDDWTGNSLDDMSASDSQVVALSAIRTCYSHLKPSEIASVEGSKYFGNKATDGEGGTEADRLFRHITRSGHTSTVEHITYTFAVEGVSRALLGQLTRHRHLSFSVQSQRYVRMGSDDKSGGFEYVTPTSVTQNTEIYACMGDDLETYYSTVGEVYNDVMLHAQKAYDDLREMGVPPEDARMVLPNATACNLVMTGNLRTFLDFYSKRQKGRGAQWEIADLAEKIRIEIVKVDPWLAPYFEGV